MKNLDLLEIRKQLDEVDAQMVRLFEERMALSMDVAKSKLASGKAVYDGQREKEKLAALEKMTEGDFNRQAVRELFTQLMTIGRKRQYQYLAEHGKALDLGFCPVDSLKKEGVRVWRALTATGRPSSFSERIRLCITFPAGRTPWWRWSREEPTTRYFPLRIPPPGQ